MRRSISRETERGPTWRDFFASVDDQSGGLPIFSRNRSKVQTSDNFASLEDVNWAIDTQRRALQELNSEDGITLDSIENLDKLVEWCLPPTADEIKVFPTADNSNNPLQRDLRRKLFGTLAGQPIPVSDPSLWYGCLESRIALEQTISDFHVNKQATLINEHCVSRVKKTLGHQLTLRQLHARRVEKWDTVSAQWSVLGTAITGIDQAETQQLVSSRELLVMTQREKEFLANKLKHIALIKFLAHSENLLKQRNTTPFCKTLEQDLETGNQDIKTLEGEFLTPVSVFPCKKNTLDAYKLFVERSYYLRNTTAVLRSRPTAKYQEMLPHQKQLMTKIELLLFERINLIVADDPGTGKATSILLYLASLAYDLNVHPHIIVIPDDDRVQRIWLDLITKWLPADLRDGIPMLTAESDEETISSILSKIQSKQNSYTAILMTFNSILSIVPLMVQFRYRLHTLIIDHRHGSLTGTPIEESVLVMLGRLPCVHRLLLMSRAPQLKLDECWAVCNFLFPRTFSSSSGGMTGWVRDRVIESGLKTPPPIIIDDDEKYLIARRLLQVACPFIIRRERDKLQELPVIRTVVLKCKASEFQRRLYWALCDYATLIIKKKEAAVRKEVEENRALHEQQTAESKAHEIELLSRHAEGSEGKALTQHDLNQQQRTVTAPNVEMKIFEEIRTTVATTAALLARALQHPALFYQYCTEKEKWYGTDQDATSTFIRGSGKMGTLHCILREIQDRTAADTVHKILIYTSHIQVFDTLGEYLTRAISTDKLSAISKLSSEAQQQEEVDKYQSDSTGVSVLLLGIPPVYLNLAVTDTLLLYDAFDDVAHVDLVVARCRPLGDPMDLRVIRLQSIFANTQLPERIGTVEAIAQSIGADWNRACTADDNPVSSLLTSTSFHIQYETVVVSLLKDHFESVSKEGWNKQPPKGRQTVDVSDTAIEDMQLPDLIDTNRISRRHVSLLSIQDIPRDMRSPLGGDRILSSMFPPLLNATISVVEKESDLNTTCDDIFKLLIKDGYRGEITTSEVPQQDLVNESDGGFLPQRPTAQSAEPLLLSPDTLSTLKRRLEEEGYEPAIISNLSKEPTASLARLCRDYGIPLTFVEAKLQHAVSKWLDGFPGAQE